MQVFYLLRRITREALPRLQCATLQQASQALPRLLAVLLPPPPGALASSRL
jgi:hypothetical protein